MFDLSRLARPDTLPLDGRAVFLRVDLNVPLKGGQVHSDARLRAAVPGITQLLEAGARLVIASHLGQPKAGRDKALTLVPVIEALSGLLSRDIVFCEDAIGESPKVCLDQLRPGEAMALENLRFWPGEEANTPAFARELSQGIDVYIGDAFASMHRAHASIVGLPALVPHVGVGPLVAQELEALGQFLSAPKGGKVAIVGGAKVSDKIGLLRSLCDRTECLMIGGAMANTFLAATGHAMGHSRVEQDALPLARSVLARAREKHCDVWLPGDHVVAAAFDASSAPITIAAADVPDALMSLDIGEQTRARYAKRAREARAVFWNGPMGVAEWPSFAHGSREVARGVAACPELSIVGGGDSLAVLEDAGVLAKIRHASTGGGAALALLERGTLPGLEAMARAQR